MSDFNKRLELLSSTLEECNSSVMPRSNRVFKEHDTDINLYLEDAYLCGLAGIFLHSKRPVEQRLDQKSIVLNSSIDFELNDYHPSSEKELEIIVSFQSYRKKMMELALALSQASGLPIEWR